MLDGMASSLAATALPALGGLIVATAAPARAAAAASAKVRVGLIGCGGMGRGDLPTFLLNPEVECPVICDVDDAQLALGHVGDLPRLVHVLQVDEDGAVKLDEFKRLFRQFETFEEVSDS